MYLIHFMSQISFNNPWKHQRTSVLMFSEGIKRDQQHEMVKMFPGGLERDQWHEMN